MEPKVQENHEKATIIDGVVLTDKCLHQLESLQENDNEGLRMCRETMADAISAIAILFDYFQRPEDQERSKRIITDLSYVRDYFLDLRKP